MGGIVEHKSLFIDGEWVAPARESWLDVWSPSTEQVVGRVPVAGAAELDAAIAAARRAFDEGPWPRTSPEERRAVVLRAAELLAPRAEELTRISTSENGIIARYNLGNVGPRFAYNATLSPPEPEIRTAPDGARARIVHEPVGVVSAIVPWNSPIPLALSKVLPALMAGCTVVLKPASETPLSAFVLVEAFAKAGLPPGVLNLVAAPREVAERMVTSPLVDHVSFTGGTSGGKRIAKLCCENVTRFHLELGGRSPVVVLDDADLAAVAPGVLGGGLLINNGEACAAWTRILVARSKHDEAVDALCAVVENVRVGDPFDPATDLGPMINESHRGSVEGYIRLAESEGARVAIGGGRPSGLDRGWYLEPTILVDAHNDMRSSREEIFGPVVSVIPYDGDDDAVRIANDSPYGLAGGVFTADPARGVEVASRIRSGTVGVNGLGFNMAFPFGGYKESGIGRQHGPESVAEFLEIKTIGLPAGMEL
jgi:acyl-CoA reductase-like NAD-dependent aldehyde dehydrogenase